MPAAGDVACHNGRWQQVKLPAVLHSVQWPAPSPHGDVIPGADMNAVLKAYLPAIVHSTFFAPYLIQPHFVASDTMYRHFATVVVLLVAITALHAPGTSGAHPAAEQLRRNLLQSQKFEICKSAFDNLGGSEEQVAQKLPACAGSQPVLGDCCSQVKGLLSQAPSDCLCDSDVWNAVQSRAGGNAGTLKQFLGACSIPNKGSGSC